MLACGDIRHAHLDADDPHKVCVVDVFCMELKEYHSLPF